MERLIEGGCRIKHPVHIRHIGHVPFVERLVEGVCVPKHTSHSLHVGHVPLVERLVEGVCVSKHSPRADEGDDGRALLRADHGHLLSIVDANGYSRAELYAVGHKRADQVRRIRSPLHLYPCKQGNSSLGSS